MSCLEFLVTFSVQPAAGLNWSCHVVFSGSGACFLENRAHWINIFPACFYGNSSALDAILGVSREKTECALGQHPPAVPYCKGKLSCLCDFSREGVINSLKGNFFRRHSGKLETTLERLTCKRCLGSCKQLNTQNEVATKGCTFL